MLPKERTQLVFSVSDFVAVFNQTLDVAYPNVIISGELANFRISKNRWVYFDLKDEFSSVKFFGSVYQLGGQLEEGMLLEVRGAPRLHPQFGFSVNVISIKPVGEGSIKRAAQLLENKLRTEGLFDRTRKRQLPYPPVGVGLITSAESAAYRDFLKIINGRFGGLQIQLADVQVQGEAAPVQIVSALEYFNLMPSPPEVLVITRGGGSAEDLAAFNNEAVARAIASSRIPTIVAIGHEIDVSLAELAADSRASTPSNAAEMLVPDRHHENQRLNQASRSLDQQIKSIINNQKYYLANYQSNSQLTLQNIIKANWLKLTAQKQLLGALNPESVLGRGYAILRKRGDLIRSGSQLKIYDYIEAQLSDALVGAKVNRLKLK